MGRSMEDLQEPGRPAHPFLKASASAPAPPSPHRPSEEAASPVPTPDPGGVLPGDDLFDPVGRIHPPLVGWIGRNFHGEEHSHHRPTLDDLAAHASDPPSPGSRSHPPGPSRRPERIYLHYLLLHMDRLKDTALLYLKRVVDEEAQHRKL